MYLESIKSPADLKKLSLAEQQYLAGEIRQRILSTVSRTGGHLASSLGTVELTLALHSVFDCPQDKIVWDVGHQAYTHKIITGRNARFDIPCVRKTACPDSPSRRKACMMPIWAVIPVCPFRRHWVWQRPCACMGKEGFAIAVIGDGSFGSGVAYEGMNNAGRSGEKIIIVLNDNDMSISGMWGMLPTIWRKCVHPGSISASRTTPRVFWAVCRWWENPSGMPWQFPKKTLRQMMYHSNLFEDFGLRYFGPGGWA